MEEYEIIKNFPIPQRTNNAVEKGSGRPPEKDRCIYPVEQLGIGDAFDVGKYTVKLQMRSLQYCMRSYYGYYLGWKFASRKVGTRLWIWRIV